MFTMNIDRPCDTSSWSDSMSAVIRATSDAGAVPVVELERQPHQVGEHPLAQVAEEPLADPRDREDHEPAEDVLERDRDEEHDDGAVQHVAESFGTTPWSMP